MPPPLIVDLETQSLCDLRASGGFVYSEHPSTRLLMASWSEVGSDEYHLWVPGIPQLPQDLVDLFLPGVVMHYGEKPPIPTDRVWIGHNAWNFDEPVWAALYPQHKPLEWRDSQCEALAGGLPAGLQQISVRLFGDGKYEEGSNALTKASKGDHEHVPEKILAVIGKYNVQDVRLVQKLLVELDASLVITPEELEVMQAHRFINARGVRLDTRLLAALRDLSDATVDWSLERIKVITGGRFQTLKDLRKRTEVLKYVNGKDFSLGVSLAKAVVDKFIDRAEETDEYGGSDGDDEVDDYHWPEATQGKPPSLKKVCQFLRLRQSALRITGGKLEAAGLSTNRDGYARGLHAYHAAHTGRFGGRRIQTQNLPVPKIGVPYWALVELFERTGKLELPKVLELLEAERLWLGFMAPELDVTATPDDCASALIRAIFMPDEGDDILDADLMAIECRMLAWLAVEDWLLQAFVDVKDPYLAFAKQVTGKDHDKKSKVRQIFKIAELACGYQGGENTLAIFMENSGIDLSEFGTSAAAMVEAYRVAHERVAGKVAGEYKGKKYFRGGLWGNVEQAALDAVERGTVVTLKHLEFSGERGHLYVRLPSGRRLCYRNARISMIVDRYGREKQAVTYDSPRFKRIALYGGKLVENIDQAISRDVLCYQMVLAWKAGFKPILHVHDSLASSSNRSRLDEYGSIMSSVPPWAPGLPVDAEGSWLPRWAKGPPAPRKDKTWLSKR